MGHCMVIDSQCFVCFKSRALQAIMCLLDFMRRQKSAFAFTYDVTLLDDRLKSCVAAYANLLHLIMEYSGENRAVPFGRVERI